MAQEYFETPWLTVDADSECYRPPNRLGEPVCFSGLSKHYDLEQLGPKIKLCASTKPVRGAIKGPRWACSCAVTGRLACFDRVDRTPLYWWVEVPA